MATSTPLSHNPPATQSTAPRKRRRRTAGGGAQDDCFTCRKRGSACDRKRPYCTQCIEIGKECTGYKTTLTWGVGVASRGKLRGLSLPVANKSTGEASTTSTRSAHEHKRRKSSVSKVNQAATSEPRAAHAATSASIPIPRSQPLVSSVPTSAPSVSWQSSMPYPATSFEPMGLPTNPTLKHIQTTFNSHLDGMHFPSSASSTGSFADVDFHTPLEYGPTSSSLPYAEHLSHSYMDETLQSPTTDSLGQSLSSLDMLSNYGQSLPTTYDISLLGQLSDVDENDYANDKLLPSIDLRFSNHLFHLPQRIQSLIHYYDTSICPFLVAFDSPQNPYRMHIIQLASHNEALQNALAALATNNMRMRARQPKSLGYIEEVDETGTPTGEETQHKQLSIEQLNAQLTQPSAPQDDSVLATLLVLCLFHVCDSGFSKFKTQLAGVQKLMSLRDPSTKSPFTGWVEMFFIWFDVMTAAVNDREPQIKGESLDMMDYSVNLGALEQYSGCDGRLFKLIARLGGLSLLAQGRATRPAPQRPSRRQFKAPLQRSLDAADYELMDGNGWGTPILEADEEDLMSSPHTDFWTEWHDIKSRLESWSVEASTFAPQSSDPSMPFDASNLTSEQQDLVHISESFRHSALLYVERLANPLQASLAPVFQQHVSQALYHITALPVTSCVNKFLLWPLFITGTECVDGGDRAVIRTRCVEIQRESGFYNNISCLDLLEKVWHEVDLSNSVGGEINARRRDSETRQAFRWRRAMDRVDGEYLII